MTDFIDFYILVEKKFSKICKKFLDLKFYSCVLGMNLPSLTPCFLMFFFSFLNFSYIISYLMSLYFEADTCHRFLECPVQEASVPLRSHVIITRAGKYEWML